ncbi:MAG: 2-hydroxychromene-2-carboxylate isomerase [Thermoanaerobaculia bacterium]|nr:2-hydroxychromene-2-carboxylate isomerase [Thermoanaerobaculia bacterium]
MPRLEFFYDCSSPWTYLAFHRIEDVAAAASAELVWRPILVGGVFNSVNPSVYENRAKPVPAKAAYYKKDLADWARLYGLRIGQPPVFPVNSVKAMRAALIAEEQGSISAWSRAVFERYWGDLEDISQDAVLEAIAQRVGLDWAEISTRIQDPATKQKLRDNTDELIARGGFGSPTMFVNGDDMYFGNDRLPLVERTLADAR